MFTKREFLLPQTPALSGNPVQDNRILLEYIQASNKAVGEIFRTLNAPNTIALSEVTIDNATVGSTTPLAGSFTTLGASGLASLASVTFSGDLTASGSGKRFLGDFSNATRANRFLFKDATTNNGTNVGAIPNGTSNVSAWTAFGGSDPDNTHALSMATSATQTVVNSTKFGTGTQRDLEWQIGGATKARINTAGSVILGTSSALNTTATDGFTYIPSCAGAPTGVPTAVTGMVPLVYDTTNNKLYAYNTAWKSVTLA